MQRNTKADATFTVEKKVSEGMSWSVDVGATMKQEKDREAEVGLKGGATLKGKF